MKNFEKIYNIITEELNVDTILSTNRFIPFSIKNGKLILEATTLSKKENAITNPKELYPLIKKYEDYISGNTVLTR